MKKTGVILARFQPVHNGHLALIKKAVNENDEVLILIGSADKLNSRNPIPVQIREELVKEAISQFSPEEYDKIKLVKLDDLSSEKDNNTDWGFYFYSKVVSEINQANFTIYYSDGYEIITKWFPGFILRNHVSMSLLARNAVESGISATEVRNLILNDSPNLNKVVPKCVSEMRNILKIYIGLNKE